MRYKFKKGDIVRFTTPSYYVKATGESPFYFYLIIGANKRDFYDVLCLNNGQITTSSKELASRRAVKVA